VSWQILNINVSIFEPIRSRIGCVFIYEFNLGASALIEEQQYVISKYALTLHGVVLDDSLVEQILISGTDVGLASTTLHRIVLELEKD